jgi:hypothetical protein
MEQQKQKLVSGVGRCARNQQPSGEQWTYFHFDTWSKDIDNDM